MLPRINDNQPIKARDLNRVIDALNKTGDIKGVSPVNVTRFAGGTQISISERGFAAEVTARTDLGASATPRWQYAVAEVQPDPDTGPGLWRPVSGGRDTPTAYEWNDQEVAVGTVVWVEPWEADDWRFEVGGGSEVLDPDSGGEEALGPYLTDLSFFVSGCTLTVTATSRPIHVTRDGAGRVVDIEEGAGEEFSTPINLASVCDCCGSDSSSGSDSVPTCNADPLKRVAPTLYGTFGGDLAFLGTKQLDYVGSPFINAEEWRWEGLISSDCGDITVIHFYALLEDCDFWGYVRVGTDDFWSWPDFEPATSFGPFLWQGKYSGNTSPCLTNSPCTFGLKNATMIVTE